MIKRENDTSIYLLREYREAKCEGAANSTAGDRMKDWNDAMMRTLCAAALEKEREGRSYSYVWLAEFPHDVNITEESGERLSELFAGFSCWWLANFLFTILRFWINALDCQLKSNNIDSDSNFNAEGQWTFTFLVDLLQKEYFTRNFVWLDVKMTHSTCKQTCNGWALKSWEC